MTTVLVTGCAGFIGSHLTERCLERGDLVRGADALTDYYDPQQKVENLSRFRTHPRFEFFETDLLGDVGAVVEGVDVILHQAGQPGVRASWREQFDLYLTRNVHVTQRLLEAAVAHGVPRVVYASSSSIYGNAERYPVDESMRLQPFSPYGVTKMAGEHLCSLYASNFGLPVVSLRYFTVYGPRQRPDMAIYRLFEAALTGTPFPLFGDGSQRRDFTYVSDVVEANLCAAEADVPPGLVANIAGGSDVTMSELIQLVEEISERPVPIDAQPAQLGDVRRSGASTDIARQHLGWQPVVPLEEGLSRQYEWHLARR